MSKEVAVATEFLASKVTELIKILQAFRKPKD